MVCACNVSTTPQPRLILKDFQCEASLDCVASSYLKNKQIIKLYCGHVISVEESMGLVIGAGSLAWKICTLYSRLHEKHGLL